jgi:dipeptidyl-peptidase-4
MHRHFRRATRLCSTLLALAPAVAAQTTGFDRFMTLVQGRVGRPTGTLRVRWLPNGQGYLDVARDSSTRTGAFSKVDPASGTKSPLFDQATVARLLAEFSKVSGSPTDRIPFDDFRHESNGTAISFEQGGSRYLFDLAKPGLRKLLLPSKVGPLNQGTTEAGKFSPDFNYYAFVRDYDNLWLCDTRTGAETRLTTATSEDNLIGFLNAGEWYVWSPDSRHIGYLKANQSALYRYPLLKDLDRHSTVEYFRYPFTTDPNPPLELRIVDVTTKQDVKVESGTIENPYLRELVWFDDGSELTYQIVNQWESRLELKAVDPSGGGTRTILVDSDSAYLDELHNFRQLKNQRFVWSSQRSGWRHLYLYDRRGTLVKQLTSGDWETGNILGVDETAGWIYFEGATHRGLDHHLFRVKLDGTALAQLTTEDGVHRLEMDPAARYVLDRHSSISRPAAVTLRTADGKRLRDLATVDGGKVESAGFRVPEVLELKTADGQPMAGLLYRPADFDSTRKYPLIVSVYGGPHTKAVRNSYQTTDYNNAIAQLGFLVAEFDARGTIDQGKRFQTGNYLRLGQVDVDDQAGAVKQLVAARPYVDGKRVGVTGISHGGYMTLMMMLRYPDVYQVGVAGAPLTDVRNGPRQYIGRFMRTPEANPEGYAQADILPRAGNLKGRLLLVHGTDDHNAVLTNTMQLARRFIDLGKPVDMMIYPNGVHVLEGADAIHNIRNSISYFLEHLQPVGWESTRAKIWGEGN